MTFVHSCLVTVTWIIVVISCHGFMISIRKSTVANLNNRPIIGVMSQTTHGELAKFGPTYIAASYIKYLESSGARVVPIMNDLSEDEILKLFKSINGVLFPGGGVNLNTSGYAEIGKRIIDLAKIAYDEGDYFPIWGSCLGFEFLSTLISGDINILSQTDSENLPLPLDFSQNYRNSKMFANIEDTLAQFLSTNPTTMNNHKYSLLSSKFEANPKLKVFSGFYQQTKTEMAWNLYQQ